ncbi:MAG: tetratricopeptide repeat protein [Leptolyngbyaceae cyanobacterium]
MIKRSLKQALSSGGDSSLIARPLVFPKDDVEFQADQGLDWIQELMDRGDYTEALMRLEQSAVGDAVDGVVAQAVCLLHLQQPKCALQACDRALALQPHHPQALLFKGVALHRLGRYRQSYDYYQQASPLVRSSHWSLSLLKGWIREIMPPFATSKLGAADNQR